MKLWDLIRLVNFDDVSEALKKQYEYEDIVDLDINNALKLFLEEN